MPTTAAPYWINEPPAHSREGDALVVVTGKDTDYWNNTFYGFRHGNGHFHATPITGDFSMVVSFSAPYANLYDQAGAMLRVDDENWLKCGVEFTDNRKNFSVVVTRDDQSDWSVMPIEGDVGAPVTLRISRYAEALRVEIESGGKFRLVRLAFLRMPQTIEAGAMCCSPAGEGLRVTFHSVSFSKPVARDLHA